MIVKFTTEDEGQCIVDARGVSLKGRTLRLTGDTDGPPITVTSAVMIYSDNSTSLDIWPLAPTPASEA